MRWFRKAVGQRSATSVPAAHRVQSYRPRLEALETRDVPSGLTITPTAFEPSKLSVTVGTTLGMLAADGLAVVVGDRLAAKVQGRWLRFIAAGLFFAFGAVSAYGALRPG